MSSLSSQSATAASGNSSVALYQWGVNGTFYLNDRQTPVLALNHDPVTGEVITSYDSLSAKSKVLLSDTLMGQILSFAINSDDRFVSDAASAFTIGTVSRCFRRARDAYAPSSLVQIFRQHASSFPPIATLAAHYQSSLELAESLAAPHDINYSHLAIRIHCAIAYNIRSLGAIPCPNSVFSSQQVDQLYRKSCKMKVEALQTIWSAQGPGSLSHSLQTLPHPPADLPGSDAPAKDISDWMFANRALLQQVKLLSHNKLLDYNNRNHKLACIPALMGLFTGLWDLHFRGNQIPSIPQGTFLRMTALQTLDLEYNRIDFLPAGAFQGLTALQTLNLANNRLTSLPVGVFQELPSLQTLWLSHNDLTSLPQGVFHGLPFLQVLYLACNRFSFWPEGVFRALSPQMWASIYSSGMSRNPEKEEHWLISCRESGINPERTISVIHAFYRYQCHTPYAQLYQLAAGGDFPEAVKAAFLALPDPFKNAIYRLAWAEWHEPYTRGNSQWGEQHVFDDTRVFNLALKRCVLGIYDRLDESQKNDVHALVQCLAQSESGAQNINFSDEILGEDVYTWGQLHALDNILRLVDALSQLPNFDTILNSIEATRPKETAKRRRL